MGGASPAVQSSSTPVSGAKGGGNPYQPQTYQPMQQPVASPMGKGGGQPVVQQQPQAQQQMGGKGGGAPASGNPADGAINPLATDSFSPSYAVANPNDNQTWIQGSTGQLYQAMQGAPGGLSINPNTGDIGNQLATAVPDSTYTGANWNPVSGWSGAPDANSRASGYYDAQGNPVSGVKDYYDPSSGTWKLTSANPS